MRKFLFVLVSTATLTMIRSAIAQYVAPPLTNPLQDRQLREFYEKQRPLDNATGSGSIGTPIQMLLVVNAPEAFQRKLVDVVTEVQPARSKLVSLARQPFASCASRADPTLRGR